MPGSTSAGSCAGSWLGDKTGHELMQTARPEMRVSLCHCKSLMSQKVGDIFSGAPFILKRLANVCLKSCQ